MRERTITTMGERQGEIGRRDELDNEPSGLEQKVKRSVKQRGRGDGGLQTGRAVGEKR